MVVRAPRALAWVLAGVLAGVLAVCLGASPAAASPAAQAAADGQTAPGDTASTTIQVADDTTTTAPTDGAAAITATITVGDPAKPVAGVTMVVRKDGSVVGRDTSGKDGVVRVVVPPSTQYQVSLDRSTLPSGVSLAPGTPAVLTPLARSSGDSPVVFQLVGRGGVVDTTPSALDRLADLFASGLRFGLVIAMASVGLSLIFGTTGLTNFAHGEMVTFGAVAAWYLNANSGGLGWPLWIAAILGTVAAAAFGGALEVGVFRPLRRRGMPVLSAMVVSIGLAFLLRYLIEVVFGASPQQYSQYAAQSPTVHLGPVDLRPKDVVVIVVAAVVLVAVGLFLQRSRMGTAIRAVSDNADLASASGIDVARVILTVWVMSGALAGFGGVLLATTETVTWNMGQRVLLVMFAAVVLGGLGTTFGAMAGGIIVGLVSDLSTFWIDSDLKIVVALATLVLVLLFRPQGVFGVRERTA